MHLIALCGFGHGHTYDHPRAYVTGMPMATYTFMITPSVHIGVGLNAFELEFQWP